MFCPSCGMSNRSNARFCTGCGTPLDPALASPMQAPVQLPVQSSQPPSVATPIIVSDTSNIAPAVAQGSGWVGTLVVVLVAILRFTLEATVFIAQASVQILFGILRALF